MVILRVEFLDVSPRARNDLLAAAGYAPIYRESSLASPGMEQFSQALDFIMRQQEPDPAVALEREWNVLLANEAAGRFMGLFLDETATDIISSPNVMRLIFHNVDHAWNPLRYYASRATH